MDSLYADLLPRFNYRAAQVLRTNRARNLKTREDLTRFARYIGPEYERSDWLFEAYKLGDRELREVLVLADWTFRVLHRDRGVPWDVKLKSDHMYEFLGTQPKEYTRIEDLWIEALRTHSSWTRPEFEFSFVGDIANPTVGGAERLLIATTLRPNALTDATWLTGVRSSGAITSIAERVRWIGTTIWMRPFDSFLQVQIPYSP
jgi:hypothetical protein